MNSTEVVLSIEEITKKFLGTTALKKVSMKLYKNEILAVMGENGAGKSTLMKILSGLYPCNSYDGKIMLLGKECRFQAPSDSENAGIAMIYQELNLELDLTVAENILLGRLPKTRIGLVDWDSARKTAARALNNSRVKGRIGKQYAERRSRGRDKKRIFALCVCITTLSTPRLADF